MQHLFTFAELLAAAGAIAGIVYCLLCIWSARNFLKSVPDPDHYTPSVSILKPLRGTDRNIYEAFRSHLQDYPEYEIIFGVSDRADPAIKVVEELMREFPGRSIRLVVCPKVLGANIKVSNLSQMLPHASGEYLIVNDSDIRVPPDYLRRVLGAFADPKLGMVTCLYRGAAGKTLPSKLESLGISTDFAAGVLSARVLEGVKFGLGATVAISRHALQAIGGFDAVLDYLADDYELGHRIAAAGFKVQLARVIVDTHLPDYSWRGFFQHQLRWARGIRNSRPRSYLGLALTFGLPWAILTLAMSAGAVWAWALLAITLAARLAMAASVGIGVLRDPQISRLFWLIPLRDVLAVIIWIVSFAGHAVIWRGQYFTLHKGKLLPVSSRVRN